MQSSFVGPTLSIRSTSSVVSDSDESVLIPFQLPAAGRANRIQKKRRHELTAVKAMPLDEESFLDKQLRPSAPRHLL